MKWLKIAVSAAMFGAVAGCAATPTDFSGHEKALAGDVIAYAQGVEAPAHSVLGRVHSNSCDSGTMARYAGSEDEAILLLKLETVRLGGDMVVGYSCATKGVDLVSNCWASKRCEGHAAKAE